MLEVWFGVSLGLLLASNVVLYLKLSSVSQELGRKLSQSQTVIESKVDIDSIKNEISDTIAEFMEGLQVPTAQDHLLGGISQIMQMWAMKKFAPAVEMMQEQLHQQ
jgi:hypothetical protein